MSADQQRKVRHTSSRYDQYYVETASDVLCPSAARKGEETRHAQGGEDSQSLTNRRRHLDPLSRHFLVKHWTREREPTLPPGSELSIVSLRKGRRLCYLPYTYFCNLLILTLDLCNRSRHSVLDFASCIELKNRSFVCAVWYITCFKGQTARGRHK